MIQYQIKAYRGDEPFAFVSYAHEDEDLVFPEISRLADQGHRIYYDEGIHPGHAWHDDLAAAIEKCAVFVLFVTRASAESRNCMRELNFALDKHREVLAIHLEDVQPPRGMQLALGDRQAVLKNRFSEADYIARLDEALNAYLGAPERSEDALADSVDRSGESHEVDGTERGLEARAAPKRMLWGAGLMVLVVVLGVIWQQIESRRAEAERLENVLEDFIAAADGDEYGRAYLLSLELDESLRQAPEFLSRWEWVTASVELQIATEGAQVAFMPYLIGTEWVPIGTTPLPKAVTLPRGVIKLRITKAGFEQGMYAVRVPGPLAIAEERMVPVPKSLAIALTPEGELADDMVMIPETDFPVWVSRWTRLVSGDHQIKLPAFAVGRREVSNAEFQEFVDAGGYTTDSYWQGLACGECEADIARSEGRTGLVDATGQPGPAGWSLGRYPGGEADLPVAGISWYEAVAYARFRGLSLPTIHHWARYALAPYEGLAHVVPTIAAAGNLNQRSVRPVTEARALGPWGTFDTAGNVREWVWNRGDGSGIAMGGGWTDYGTDAATVLPISPMARNASVGVRLIRSLGSDELEPGLLAPISLRLGDPGLERQPASDEAFEMMRYQFSANNRQAESVEKETVLEGDSWTIEAHTLRYPDRSTFRLILMKPKRVLPTYQVVVYAPHGGAFVPGRTDANLRNILGHAEKVVRTGRLVVMPVWAGSMERFAAPKETDTQTLHARQREGALAWYQDSVDALNYIDTLPDVEPGRIAYLAESYGTSVFGTMLMALQPRFRTGIFIGSGVILGTIHPMLDSVHYAPRVTQPMLMLNGAFDPVFLPEESQQPLFDLLGTPDEHKRIVRYPETGHFRYPENALAREMAGWLDEYLGPVR